MKTTGYIGVLVVMACLIAFTGCAMAAQLPKATPETQMVKTSVAISVASGSVSTSEAMVMQVAENEDGLNMPPLDPGEKQIINSYSEMGDFKNGATEYKKDFVADTGNKVLGQNNVAAHRNIQYLAQTNSAGLTGTAETTEKLVMDLVGADANAAEEILCPFAAEGPDTSPAFCNIVQAGSAVTGVQIGSLVTDASKRDIQATADFPAEFSYAITAKVVSGSVNAFMDVHAQESRPDGDDTETVKEADFVYKESDTASGQINSFSKSMYYQDGMLRI
jgi:hypothetical protein